MRSIDICEVLAGVQALIARALFFVHSLFAVWGAACVTGRKELWALTLLSGLFIMETIYSMVKRRGREPKWISPCVFIYLLTVIPPIWLMNIDMLRCTSTLPKDEDEQCAGLLGNSTVCSLITLDSEFDRKTLVYTIEQVMLLLLIIGRWLLPKGNISRDQLSQLLLIYFGISFDIMEVFYLFDEEVVLAREGMWYIILAVFSLSLFQFTFVLTVVKTRRPRLSKETRGGHRVLHQLTRWRCCHSEIWGLLMIVALQDGPFLALRLYCFGLGVFSYNLLFYTVKNVLIIILQSYRITVLILRCLRPGFDERPLRTAPTVAVVGTISSGKGWKGSGRSVNSIDKSLDRTDSTEDRLDRTRHRTGSQDFNFISAV